MNDECAVMVTGHRKLSDTALVRERLDMVLAKLAALETRPLTAVSGGAEGADTLWAQAAADAGVPFDLLLPNRWYTSRYPAAVPASLAAAARSVVFVADRPDVGDWRERWDAERWWQDNFARNAALLAAAELFVVVSAAHPRALAAAPKGGTASAVKLLARQSAQVIWVPDRADVEVCRVNLVPAHVMTNRC